MNTARTTTLARMAPLGIVFLLAAGCATSLAKVKTSLAAEPVCCGSMREFRFEPLKQGDSQRFKLAAGSPAFQFDTGKSYFRAFALPPGSGDYTVRIESFLTGENIESAYLFYPQIVTLDEQFRVVRTLAPEAYEGKRMGFVESIHEMHPSELSWKLEGTLHFGVENAAERYLVVLTTDVLLAQSTSIEQRRLPGYIPPSPSPTLDAVVLVAQVAMLIATRQQTKEWAPKEWVIVPSAPAGHLRVSIPE